MCTFINVLRQPWRHPSTATSCYPMELALQFEANLVDSLGWPQWSLRTIGVLSFAVVCVSLFQFVSDTSSSTTEKGNRIKPSTEFRWFQLQYLSVYLTLMLADWLQGTNMYTLYSSYGVNVRLLFLTGFVSSALFGTFLGIYVDQWGRKLGCLIFCVLEVSLKRRKREYEFLLALSAQLMTIS